MTKLLNVACILTLGITLACDAPWSGPSLPAGGHWVSYATLSYEGPPVYRDGIVAAESIADLKMKVVSLDLSGRPGLTKDQVCPTEGQYNSCWPRQTEQPGYLYIAVPPGPGGCDNTVKEAAAIGGRTFYLIAWVGGPNGSHCDAGPPPPTWRLLSVSKRDLPGPGMLRLRLQEQGYYGASEVDGQVELT